ncbi:Protein disulfide-isomerase 5-2 [Forsythia ovata]|uniref:Protein disulfide-isomerase 5-2 n=1 Tax=Forsythia ovata TaxID=205694 RepID=A0ABD1PUM4_9LAMI
MPPSIRLFSAFPFILLVLLTISTKIIASESPFKVDGKVLELDESNFDAAISTFDYIFVDFYAPWCSHCKRLAPELDKAAPVLAGLKKPIIVAKVNADKYKRLASKHEIDGYPTLKIFVHGVPTEYYGPRPANLLVRFLTKFVAPDVAILDSDSAISDLWKQLYKNKAWFSVAKDFSDNIMTSYDFDKVPALIATHPAHDEQSIFYGPFEDKFLEDYIKQSLLPLVLPINEDSLKSLKDDKRKIVLTIMEDETDENGKILLNHSKSIRKLRLPKMIVWDGNEEYYSVIGSESIEESDPGSQISKFLESYRVGSVIQKRISGPTLMGFINSQLGGKYFFISILVLLVIITLIITMGKEEPLTVGTRDQIDHSRNAPSQPEARESRRDADKED